MEEIRDTFAEEGDWGKELSTGIADVFRVFGEDNPSLWRSSSIERFIFEVHTALQWRKSHI
jgi:hypothetical protein